MPLIDSSIVFFDASEIIEAAIEKRLEEAMQLKEADRQRRVLVRGIASGIPASSLYRAIRHGET